MGMKASAHSDARGALCSIRSQPSAEESHSPTLRVTNLTLPYARTAWWYWRQVFAALVGTQWHALSVAISSQAMSMAPGPTAEALRMTRAHDKDKASR